MLSDGGGSVTAYVHIYHLYIMYVYYIHEVSLCPCRTRSCGLCTCVSRVCMYTYPVYRCNFLYIDSNKMYKHSIPARRSMARVSSRLETFKEFSPTIFRYTDPSPRIVLFLSSFFSSLIVVYPQGNQARSMKSPPRTEFHGPLRRNFTLRLVFYFGLFVFLTTSSSNYPCDRS